MTLDALLAATPGQVSLAEKEAALLALLSERTAWHRQRCPAYARLLDQLHPGVHAPARLADLPWLPVGLFKSHELASVPPAERFKVLHSSGTTGQARSRIVLDRATAALQARGLAACLRPLLGPRRLPMLLVESDDLLTDQRAASARGAGVLGMMALGRDHLFALDPDLELRVSALRAWLSQHGHAPFVVFGFTFLVWRHLALAAEGLGLDLSQAILVHSGGWKKLQDQAVDRATFRAGLRDRLGIRRVHDFYGMVEQVGSVFLEGEDGLLYPPPFGEVLVRDPLRFEVLPDGQEGLLQVLSPLPLSYPGHSLLTADLGVVHRVERGPGGVPARGLQVRGRVPRAELRGCSDTHGVGAVGGAP